ncbi:MAG TPA: RNA pseudouridine synthase [Saprospiraceae bacterium]|nr:RNA pseudouridine synthase [Saprospiraceae bacterium]HMP22532.1 RNA pseudouridine synthase [Saprospiraceae bacterium]
MKHEFAIGDLVLYKNNQFIAFNKPANVPVQADKTGDKDLLGLGEIYTKSTLHLIHRLDRPATGVVLFAKTSGALAALNEQFQNRSVQKTYLAVVKNAPPHDEGTLLHFLRKNARQNRSFATETETPGSKRAELQYRLIGSSDNYQLLEIRLISGRHHQIRAQLSAIGCPVKGDDKYGFRRANADHSIHLHAWKLRFQHPISGNWEEIVAPLPAHDPVWAAFETKIAEVG